MKLNLKNRKTIDEKYLKFIRRLPCAISYKMGSNAHHVDVIGMSGIRNDYYAIPLHPDTHTGRGHISRQKLEDMCREDVRDLCMFYLGLYIKFLCGGYDPDLDESEKWYQLQKGMVGI